MCQKCDEFGIPSTLAVRMTMTNSQDNDLSSVISKFCHDDPWVLVKLPIDLPAGVDMQFNVATSSHVNSLAALALILDGLVTVVKKNMTDQGLDPDAEMNKAADGD